VPWISSSSSSIQNNPTSNPKKKSSTKSSPDTSEVSPNSYIHVSGPIGMKDLIIGMVNIVESFFLIDKYFLIRPESIN